MASLLPLLHDLLPMIMPSEAHMVRGDAPPSVEERAETPPWWYQQQSSGAERGPAPGASSPAPRPRTGDDDGQVSISSSESDAGLLLEPIQLLDREERLAAAIVPVWTRQGHSSGPTPKPPQQTVTAGPKVFRRDVMVGVTDKMCATDTIIFAANGSGVLLTSPTADAVKALRANFKDEEPTREEEQPHRLELGPGDFAFVPAWTEHQIVNEQHDGCISWVILRSGGSPVQVDLSTWGGRRLT